VKDARGNVLRTLEATTAWPTHGVVTTEFGGTTNFQKFHSGIDIAGKKGDPITVFMTGTVAHVEHDPKKSGLGIHVIVDHGNHITSRYGHLSDVYATEGQVVNPGDVLGVQGNTGNVQPEGGDGTHLHFEIRVAELPVEPRTFFIGNPPR
jgi:murein DD-endopeptidase MepM/ murein hydrolase activator NlpD